jgi:glycosyltransferase involved in cell wall biosynthesis
MNIVFCWSSTSGYMAACWRELASRNGFPVYVVAHKPRGDSAFDESIMRGINHRLLDQHERRNYLLIEDTVVAQQPDVVVITGWWLKEYRKLTRSQRLAKTKFVMGVDSPWRHAGQYLTRWRYRRYFAALSHIFVTGERSWQYVRRLGFRAESISSGMYGVNFSRWESVAVTRQTGGWPKAFLFLGRYSREKGLDVLMAAYQCYRQSVSSPWNLVCCGKGGEQGLLRDKPGVEDMGFVQPDDLDGIFLRAGAFVLPSRFDPWPLALVEAAAAGLPIICSDACGSSVENVRPFYNGFVLPSGSVGRLAKAMSWVHGHSSLMPEWGTRSTELARAYSATAWADRWIATLTDLFST